MRVFTDADREAFAGLLPFAPGVSVPFTPEAFQSVEEAMRPVFQMAPLSKDARALVRKHSKEGTLTDEIMIEAMIMEGSACRGWISFYSMPNGDPIPFTREGFAQMQDWLFVDLWNYAEKLTYRPQPTKEEKEGLTA